MNLESLDQTNGVQYKQMNLMKNMKKAIAKSISNMIVAKQKINVPLQEDFIEQNMARMNVSVQEEKFQTLFNESIHDDSKVVLEGVRTPFIKQKLVKGKESNLIQQGQLCEYKHNLFVGCKDGTIRSIPFRPESFLDKQVISQWCPHQNNTVRTMSMVGGKMVTNSNDNELKVWDIEQWLIGSTQDAPPCMLTIENVLAFEIREHAGEQLLSYAKENLIETIKIEKEMDASKVVESAAFDEMKAEFICWTEEKGVFVLDKTQIKRRFNDEVTIVQERPSSQKVKVLYMDGDIAVSVSANTLSQDTILQLIDLSPPAPIEEGEELKLQEDQDQAQASPRKTLRAPTPQSRPQSRQAGVTPSNKSQKSQAASAMVVPSSMYLQLEDEEEAEISNVTTHNFDGSIGECLGVCKSQEQRHGKDVYLVTGAHGVAIIQDKAVIRTIKTEFTLSMAIFSNDSHYIIMIGTDGRFRSIEWTSLNKQPEQYLQESSINDAVSSANSKFFALLTNNQRTCAVYRYSNLEQICKLDNLDNVFLINFSANSKVFIIVYNDTETDQQVEEEAKKQSQEGKLVIDKTYMVYLVPLDNALDMKDPPFRIRLQDYPYQIDTCVSRRQLYALCMSESSNSSSLYTYDYNVETPVHQPLRNIVSMVVSPDEKLLAYTDNSGTIFMNFVQKWDIVNEIKTLQVQNEVPKMLRFYENQKVLVCQTQSAIYGIDTYTHKIVFKIIHSSFSGLLNKVIVIQDEIIVFVDSQHRLCVYDISTKYPGQECKIITKPLERKKLVISDRFNKINHIPWASVGYHLIMELENTNKLLFQKSPFLHNGFTMEDCLHSPFEEVDGFYIPITMGGPIMSTGSFADIFNNAYQDAKNNDSIAAVRTLQTPIYPFRLNALHFFALTHNAEGAAFCFKKRVKWINDIFGKSPLDYALKSGDRQIIETVIQGLFETEYEDREAVMRELPLHLLLKYAAVYLPPLLREAGSSVPDDSLFCGGATQPVLFPLKKQMFGESSQPIYDLQMKEQLHPDKMLKKLTRNRAISTLVLNNPVPVSYCDDSLDLLAAIIDCKSDDVVRSKPITLYLNRKWKAFAYRFYLTQFVLFITLLLSLTFVDTFQEKWAFNMMFTISIVINLYFFFYECVQICIQKLGYFQDPNNILDVARLTLIFMISYSKYDPEFGIPDEILPITFMLMWVKILSYFSVFKPTRYLIKMIFEIIADILTFLIILFTAIFAYAQINYSIKHAEGLGEDGLPVPDQSFPGQLRIGYAMAYGDLGNFMEFNYVRFTMFCLFSFFIPLVLLNMLIALMSDSYARVQTNAVAADCRALAQLELELEELVYFFYSIWKPHLVVNKYYYCFCTMVNDGDDDEGWEGTVGQLKATIKEQSETLQAKVIESVNESIKERTNEVLDRIVKTNTETQNRIDQTQKIVEKESKALNDNVNTQTQQSTESIQAFTQSKLVEQKEQIKSVKEQLSQEYTTQGKEMTSTLQETTKSSFKNVNELIYDTHSKQEKLLNTVGEVVKTESSKIITENDKKTSQVMKTIDETSIKESEKVEQNVNKQGIHHKEMVGFAVTSQNKVNELLQETSDQQKKLLVLIDELKEIQRKELESIAKQEEKQHQEAQLKEQRSKQSQEQRQQQDAKASGIASEISKVQQIFTKQIEDLKTQQVKDFTNTTKEIQSYQKQQEEQQENVKGDLKKVLVDLQSINELEQQRIKQQEISEKEIKTQLVELTKAAEEQKDIKEQLSNLTKTTKESLVIKEQIEQLVKAAASQGEIKESLEFLIKHAKGQDKK